MESELGCEGDKPNAGRGGAGQTAHAVMDSSLSGPSQDSFFYSTHPAVQTNYTRVLNYEPE